ncbi:hypothetical protein V1264_011290 [Littorina saxatilis]|uniref:Apple domain-containing protein n=2 Tax=Littorina saxatilis TaxID=31220 RepID=A0AAN9BUD5_9CAEN
MSFLLLLQPFTTLALSMEESVAKQLTPLANLFFTDNQLFNKDDTSVARCAQMCLMSDACKLFTLTENSNSSTTCSSRRSSLRCRGHSSVARNGAGRTPSPGSRMFILARGSSVFLEKPCSSNADCSAANSECFVGKCLCTPGYYYSITGDTCLASCPQAEMQETYVLYPRSVMRQNNLRCPTIPQDQCLKKCGGNKNCKNVVFWTHSSVCCLKSASALDAPSDWETNVDNAYTYVKNCL